MKLKIMRFVNKGLLTKLLFTVILNNILSAMATYSLVKAGLSFSQNGSFAIWILTAIAIFALTPFLALIQRPIEMKLSIESYKAFLEEKLFSLSGKASYWTQKSSKECFLASVGPEVESYLGALIYVGTDLVSYVLNIFFGALVIGLLIDSEFIAAYVISAVLSYFGFRFFEKKVVASSNQDQDQRVKLNSLILLAFENIFFNNKQTLSIYKNKFNKTYDNTVETTVTATLWSESFVATLSFLAALPVFVIALKIAFTTEIGSPILAALLASLPRQMNLLSTFKSLFQAIGSLIAFNEKFNVLESGATIEPANLNSRINYNEIFINGVSLGSSASFDSRISGKRGRFTITGKNGAGKSSFLLSLNESLQNSFYIPANPLMLTGEDSIAQSTGQNMLRYLKYVATLDVEYVLLDEWDANLDQKNVNLMNELIQELAQKKCVIEIRH